MINTVKSLRAVGLGVFPDSVKPMKPHSVRNSEKTAEYHKRNKTNRDNKSSTIGRVNGRAVQKLNPNPSVDAARTGGRRYPGLAN